MPEKPENTLRPLPAPLTLIPTDPVVPASQIQDFTARLTEAGVDWQLHLYGGVGHSFTNPEIDAWNLPGFRYDANADRRAWAALLQLLGETFG